MTKVLIVGSGVGGLTAGGGLHVGPNGMRAFQHVGLAERIEGMGKTHERDLEAFMCSRHVRREEEPRDRSRPRASEPLTGLLISRRIGTCSGCATGSDWMPPPCEPGRRA